MNVVVRAEGTATAVDGDITSRDLENTVVDISCGGGCILIQEIVVAADKHGEGENVEAEFAREGGEGGCRHGCDAF